MVERGYERKSRAIFKEEATEKLPDSICLWRLELKMLEVLLSVQTNTCGNLKGKVRMFIGKYEVLYDEFST